MKNTRAKHQGSSKPKSSGKKNIKNRNYVHDPYTQKAQKQGFAARSVFKLSAIDEQQHLINKHKRVLELGASPGSWSRYTLQKLEGSGLLFAVDLKALSNDPVFQASNFRFLQGDFTSPEVQKQLLQSGPFSLILSDMAPNTCGNRLIDTARSLELVEMILSLLPKLLEKGGNLLFKIFQGGEEQQLLQELKKSFSNCSFIKPPAVRDQSFEIYILCRKYRQHSEQQASPL